MLIINTLAVILSFEIYLKSQLTNVKDILLRITSLGRMFKIPKKLHDFVEFLMSIKGMINGSPHYGLSIITTFHQQLIQ